ncbi:MAG: SpoIIE family protein phosphatase [Elusimicrobiota bacterium]|nr:SpoIIE family protein phosphatase [Elusimicrobiota bacterium]
MQNNYKKELITKEQAEKSEYKNILTRALGVNAEVEIDTAELEALPGDCVLLCTDGLTRMVPEKKILEIVQSTPEPAEICQKLISEANAAGGIDNIAVAVANFVF